MSKLDAYVAERSKKNPEFAQIVEQENINLEVAVKVRDLRANMGLSQREFANLIGKPQSTIARIENGSMNASTKILSEIAQATNQRLTIQLVQHFKIYYNIKQKNSPHLSTSQIMGACFDQVLEGDYIIIDP